MECYDPFFFPSDSILSQKYDFVTCTEAIEHFFEPKKEWKLLLSLLKENGKIYLFIEENL